MDMSISAETRFVDRGEGRIGYDVTGAGPLVVCVPGMGDLRRVYRFVVPELAAAGYRVATMDLRGHGDSDPTFSAYDDVAAGQDVLALIEHLGGPAVVLGNSMAAGAAVWAAAERPTAVTGLVLLGPFVHNTPVNPLLRWALRLAMAGPWRTAVWRSYLPVLYAGERPAGFEEHRAAVVAALKRPGYGPAFRATTHTTHAPAEERLDQVSAPTLVVMGERDPDFTDPAEEGRWVAERLHGDLLLVPDAGHYPQAQRPDLVNPAVVNFLARVAPVA
jgi:pimeloyl-ACP methyl ester carboxylesterase